MSEVTPPPSMNSNARKKRHGCVTTYLAFMIVVNSAVALLYLLGSDWVRRAGPNIPNWAFWVLAVGGLVNVVCAIALFRWKKWGFWGFIASAAGVFAVNLAIGLGPGSAIGGLLGVAVLYGVLHIGQEKKAWTQLE